MPFTSTQRVTTRRPGFVWDARMAMAPGLTVHVHDAYIAGEGILHPAVLGLVSLTDLRGARARSPVAWRTASSCVRRRGRLVSDRAAAKPGRPVGRPSTSTRRG